MSPLVANGGLIDYSFQFAEGTHILLESLLQAATAARVWRLWSVQLQSSVPPWMVQVRLLDCVFDKCIAFPSRVATLGLPSTGGSYTAELHVIITLHIWQEACRALSR